MCGGEKNEVATLLLYSEKQVMTQIWLIYAATRLQVYVILPFKKIAIQKK